MARQDERLSPRASSAPTAEHSASTISPAESTPSSPGRQQRREAAQAVALLLLLIVVFLWKPLTTSNGYYAPTDVLQNKAILQVPPPGYQVQNPVQYDPPVLFYPWEKWNKSSLSRFQLPTWNPYNASGVPHLANFESAVFSPFSVPFYVFPFRIALIASDFLKLFVAGLFTYLFMRRVRLGHLAGLTGSVIFMFCAYNVLWLNWTAAASTALLPVGLYCAELVIQARDRTRLRLALAALSVAVAVSLLVGYAETTAFALATTVAWLTVRLAIQRASWAKVLASAGATVLGLLLAAVQLLPFVEYLGQSTSYAARAATAPPTQDSRFIGLLGFPNLFGNQSQAYHDLAAIPNVAFRNFNEVASIYVGLITIFLALVGLTTLRKRRDVVVVFFGIVAVAWALYAYNIAGIEHALRFLPGLRQAYPGRSDPVWAFAAGCLAAAGVDRAIDWSRARPSLRDRLVPVAGLLVLGGLVMGWAFYEKRRLLTHFANIPGSTSGSILGRNAIGDHVLYMSLTYVAGVAAVILLVLAGRRRVIVIGAGALLVAMVFAQSGYLFRHYNPTVNQRYFYPVTPALTAFTSRTGDAQTLRLNNTDVPADANLWYKLNNPLSYDAIGVKHYDQLYKGLLRSVGLPITATAFLEYKGPRNLAGLQALGIRFVSTDQDYPYGVEATDPKFADPSSASPVSLGEPGSPASPGQSISQDFTAGTAGVDLIIVPLANAPAAGCRLSMTLEELPSGRPVASSAAPCNLPATTFPFPRLADSAARQYRVVISGGDGASLLRSPSHVVMAAYSTDVPELQPVESFGSLQLFAVPNGPSQYFSPADASSVRSDSDALSLLEEGRVDVNRTVLLDQPGSSSFGSPGSVQVIKRDPTEVRLSVTRAQPGWLVAFQTYYPGWTATVNGHRVPISRANVAFSAVPVGQGTSNVVLSYQPKSVSIGLVVSGLSLLILLALVISVVPWHRATRGS